jgi:hypothetical protein
MGVSTITIKIKMNKSVTGSRGVDRIVGVGGGMFCMVEGHERDWSGDGVGGGKVHRQTVMKNSDRNNAIDTDDKSKDERECIRVTRNGVGVG